MHVVVFVVSKFASGLSSVVPGPAFAYEPGTFTYLDRVLPWSCDPVVVLVLVLQVPTGVLPKVLGSVISPLAGA